MARRIQSLPWILVVLALGGCVTSQTTPTIVEPAP